MTPTEEKQQQAEASTALAVKPTAEQLELAYSAILDGTPIPGADDPEAVSRAILERLMQADEFDDVFGGQQELPGWKTYLDTPVRILEVKLNPSTIAGAGEQGSSVYAVVDIVVLETGEQVTVSCGGRNVLVQLVKGLEHGWFADGHAYKLISKPTAAGYEALWLEAVEGS